MNKYRNKDGQLSWYALLCGDVQETNDDTLEVIMYNDMPMYQVKVRTVSSLTEARKAFKRLVKEYLWK